MLLRRMSAVFALLLVMVVIPQGVAASTTDNQPLRDFATFEPTGEGAHTTLKRDADGIRLGVHARGLVGGHAYTVWVVVFNAPDGCFATPCGEPDLFNPAAMASIIWSGIGGVATAAGTLNGHGALGEGNPLGYQQLLTDLGLFDAGFLDAEGAEIHTVVRDHGPVSGDPAQLSTFHVGCTPASSLGLGAGVYDCVDVAFSIHQV